MDTEFVLPANLSDGKTAIASWPLCEVLLTNDALYPGWLVLVPRRPNVTELWELSAKDQVQLMQEISQASCAIQKAFSPDKLNVGALGNVVPDLHIHVVPRFRGDKAWPGPVWGAHPAKDFETGELHAAVLKIQECIKLVNSETKVEYYGTRVILKSFAQISTPDESTILVSPFDKSRAMEKVTVCVAVIAIVVDLLKLCLSWDNGWDWKKGERHTNEKDVDADLDENEGDVDADLHDNEEDVDANSHENEKEETADWHGDKK